MINEEENPGHKFVGGVLSKKLNGFNNGRDTTDGIGSELPFDSNEGKEWIDSGTVDEKGRKIEYWGDSNLKAKLYKEKMESFSQLPMWTEIYIQPLDINNIEESKVYWLKHPRTKTTVYDKDLLTAVREFIILCEKENIK